MRQRISSCSHTPPPLSSFTALLCYQHRAWRLNLATYHLLPADDYGNYIHYQVKPAMQK